MLAEGLKEAGISGDVAIAEDLWDLPQHLSDPVVDQIVAGSDFPMVAVDDRVVCVGSVDIDAVVRALAAS